MIPRRMGGGFEAESRVVGRRRDRFVLLLFHSNTFFYPILLIGGNVSLFVCLSLSQVALQTVA